MSRFFLLILLLAGQLQTSGQSRQPLADKGTVRPSCGPIANQVFKCPKFGFIIRVPFGWVDRTNEMPEQAGSGSDGSVRQGREGSDSQVLLAVFERPPEVKSDTINSAIVIAAERQADYPGIKSAGDYVSDIADSAQKRGFRVAGEPYTFLVDGRRFMRGDFNREQGKLTMWQSSLVMIENHSILSFTFIGGSDEETEELIAQLNFSPPKTK